MSFAALLTRSLIRSLEAYAYTTVNRCVVASAEQSSQVLSTFHLCRYIKKIARDIRAGEYLLIDGKYYQVVKHTINHGSGRGVGSISTELLDCKNGSRAPSRFRQEESVEVAETVKRKCTVMYTENNTVHVLDTESYEQLPLPVALFGDGRKFLFPDVQIDLKLHGETVIGGTLPVKVKARVTGTKDAAEDSGRKQVEVEGGMPVAVPSHVQVGDEIWIRTEDGTFASKVAEK